MFAGLRWDVRLTDKETVRVIARLDKPSTHLEIAEMLGCSERTVRRSIRRLSGVIVPSRPNRFGPCTYTINYALLPESLRRELNGTGE